MSETKCCTGDCNQGRECVAREPKPKVCIQCRVRKAVGILLRAGQRQPRCQPCIDARRRAERTMK
jgi:hypothetical protein